MRKLYGGNTEFSQVVERANDILGGHMVVDESTGEVISNDIIANAMSRVLYDDKVVVRDGSKYREIKKGNDLINNIGGNYYHMMYEKILNSNFEENYAVRFLLLCTYLNYENKLVIGETRSQRKIRENELQDILKLSERETRNTKNYLVENGLIVIDEDSVITVNSEYIVKGKVRKNSNMTRVFENGFKELYNGVSPRQHNILFTFVKIVPYLSKEFNIICENPEETDISLIKPLKWADVGERIGLNKEQSKKLKQKLFKLKVNNRYAIGEFLHELGKKIVVNPAIFWKANESRIDKVAFLFEC